MQQRQKLCKTGMMFCESFEERSIVVQHQLYSETSEGLQCFIVCLPHALIA